MITITFNRWKFEEDKGGWEQVDFSYWHCPPRVGEFLRLDGKLWKVSEVLWEDSESCTIRLAREYEEEAT